MDKETVPVKQPPSSAEESIPSPATHADHIGRIRQWLVQHRATGGLSARWGRYFQRRTLDYLAFLIGPELRVLSLGCGVGDSLARVSPSVGVGIDLDATTLSEARRRHPGFKWIEGDIEDPETLRRAAEAGPFDVILLEDTLGYLDDVQTFLTNLAAVCTPDTRLVSVYYGYLWAPVLRLAEALRIRSRSFETTWFRMVDVENFMDLGGFETVKKEWRILCPFRWLGLGSLVNRFVATMPLLRRICIRHYLVARPKAQPSASASSVSVVVPCRNERGNIEPLIARLPPLGSHTELIFVEGHSSDGTWEEVQRVQEAYPTLDIKSLQQPGEGKGDAVRAAFEQATGDVLMILDADLTVPPEDLPKFLDAIDSGRGEYINGSRLIYGMEDQAMRFLNYIANHGFALVFTYLLNQRLTDTLCGTKVLRRRHYEMLARNRDYFGDFDPFGDFDLIFGASKLNLKFVEVPVRYASRKYGSTQISRFRHGFLLLQMVLFAFRKMKAI